MHVAFTTQQFAHCDIKMGLDSPASLAIVDPEPLGTLNSVIEMDMFSFRMETEAAS
jgi:hypothetical protein